MKTLVLATAFAIGAGGASAASLIVDDYSTFLQAETSAPAPVLEVAAQPAPNGSIGDRIFSVEKTVGGIGLAASTSSLPGTGLSLAAAGMTDAIHRTKYTFDPIDVTEFNVIAFEVDFLDLAGVTFDAILTDSSMTSETEEVILNQTAGPMFGPSYTSTFNLANFDVVELDDLTMIEFVFDGLQGADLILRNIEFQVPVPAALPLLLTGLGGFGLLRLRRKS